MADIKNPGPQPVGSPLYLRDEELKQGVDLLFFASRGVSAEGAKALKSASLGPAHARAIYFIARNPGLSVADLQGVLKVAKQSLNRVLSELIAAGYVERKAGMRDRRTRVLRLSARGAALETAIWDAQRPKLVRAFREAGPEAVMGFRRVLMGLVDRDQRPKDIAP
ncbi:MAG TPA: MarR family winged helix-turn-helix transcriptional regulator [Rhizomicrobium sp.]|jgi:DNA-binding MarR family transcriptional regulator